MNEFAETQVALQWQEMKRAYDVVIVGGGGHGLATAYYLATRHGITDVAVLERGYIGGGNSGRNTTIIRANYGTPEAVRFYHRSLKMYEELEGETSRWLMHSKKNLLWIAHSEAGVVREKARAAKNQAFGADTVYITPSQVKAVCPQIDLNAGDGRYPVLGASMHIDAATARHDRVNWALAEGAMRHGVHILQDTAVTGIETVGDKVVGVDTSSGSISTPIVVSAVGGHVSRLATMAGLRLPIRTHPLQAFVTNHYEQQLEPIVASADLLFYVSQTARGEMLLGAEIDRQPSYSSRSGHRFLASNAHRAVTLLPFMRKLRILRQWAGVCDMSPDYSPIMGKTGIDGFLMTTGWGTWGFKAIPAGGEAMAQLVATGHTPELIAPFNLDRFANDRLLADRGSAGTH